MNLRLIAVDKIRTGFIADACSEFRKRLAPYYPYDEIEVRAAHGGNAAAAVDDEGERIMRLIAPSERVWLLERSGTELSSTQLSERLDAVAHEGISRLTFVVAGTYGASDALLARANFTWSLSALTFLHEWARAIVLEQLYRAAKIARNEPYHH